MALFDLPLEQLQTYRPERAEPYDFDTFWQATLEQTRMHPLEATFEPIDFGLSTIETFDVSFRGFGGQVVRAWLLLPRQRSAPLPCVVEYIGYGGGRGFPNDWLWASSAGFAHLVMDTRGQGSGWLPGSTPDLYAGGGNPEGAGWMTRGILDPQHYYYRRVFTDAVRAIEAARSFAGVDPQRIAVTGVSQGGGITLAAAALEPSVQLALPDVPFLCHYRRAVELTDTHPYNEVAGYCRTHRGLSGRVFETLSYFDGVNFAARAHTRALFSTALMDQVCPPSTVFAAYNHYAGDKEIRVYDFNGHEGGGGYQTLEKIKVLREVWG